MIRAFLRGLAVALALFAGTAVGAAMVPIDRGCGDYAGSESCEERT